METAVDYRGDMRVGTMETNQMPCGDMQWQDYISTNMYRA